MIMSIKFQKQQATIGFARAIVACGVSLSNVAHASQSPQSNTPRAIAVRDVSLSQLKPRIHQFTNCHRARPAAAVRYRTWQTDTCSLYAHFPCETGFVVVATTAYRAVETETTVRHQHRVSPSGIRAGLAGGLLVGVASVFTLVTGRYRK